MAGGFDARSYGGFRERKHWKQIQQVLEFVLPRYDNDEAEQIQLQHLPQQLQQLQQLPQQSQQQQQLQQLQQQAIDETTD